MSEVKLSNVPEYSVGELAGSLKKTLEDTYGRVRVRGELSRVSVAGSGHMYSSLKDDQAVVDAVCWRGVLSKLSVKPEEGLEVICTGRISSYPKSSKYQLIIESMELAGEGALLKMLEDRKKKLAAEGLFAPERKKNIPYLPHVIGVVTSPTGAVIRDILHRLQDRFPRRVLLWPVAVQGDQAAAQIEAAIRGFNALSEGGTLPRPDVLIVARGGGSLEDLMAFNEENVVRAAAESQIPLISAVGHETDTTLIDHAADRRAPTPTGAAEIAVPRRADLQLAVSDMVQRLTQALYRSHRLLAERVEAMGARLADPRRVLEAKTQNLDFLSDKMRDAFSRDLMRRDQGLQRIAARITHPRHILKERGQAVIYASQRLNKLPKQIASEPRRRLDLSARMLESLSFKRVLDRGFAVVRDDKGKIVTKPGILKTGDVLQIEFKDDVKVDTIIGKKPHAASQKPKKSGEGQETLF